MYPFEVFDERTQRVEFYFNRFAEYKRELFSQYPATQGHARIEFDLIFPSDRLQDVYVHDWNPHHQIGNHHLSVYDCFYDSSSWSTIFEAYDTHRCYPQQRLKVFAEEGHHNPWGEPIRLMSTSSNIYNNSSHRFACFRGKFWKVLVLMDHRVRDRFTEILAGFPLFQRRGFELRGDIAMVGNTRRWASRFEEPEEEVDWLHEGF